MTILPPLHILALNIALVTISVFSDHGIMAAFISFSLSNLASSARTSSLRTLQMEHQCSPTFPEYSTRNPSSFQESVRCKELVWPPRFYGCSFCRREFRSSQALGGHMNVHRRDRAMLKQQYSPTSSPPVQSSHVQKDTAIFFRDITLRGLQMFPSFVSAGDHEIRKPMFKDSELLDETVVSCKRIRKSDHSLPCLRRELFANCKKISGSMEDVDLELRLGSNPTSPR